MFVPRELLPPLFLEVKNLQPRPDRRMNSLYLLSSSLSRALDLAVETPPSSLLGRGVGGEEEEGWVECTGVVALRFKEEAPPPLLPLLLVLLLTVCSLRPPPPLQSYANIAP